MQRSKDMLQIFNTGGDTGKRMSSLCLTQNNGCNKGVRYLIRK